MPSEDAIYLAGPVEHDDDPRSWRDLAKSLFPDVEFVDPMDWQSAWEDDPAAVWERELDTCRTTPVLACNIGSDAPRTTGTHHEIREAINHDQPVAIVPKGDVSQIYTDIEDVRVFDDVESAIAWLAVPSNVAADGGEVSADDTGRPEDGTTNHELAERFNNRNDCSLRAQTLKLSEEVGEVSEAVLGYTGELLFKDEMNAEDVGDELADLCATAHYVAELVGIDDLDDRTQVRLFGNIARTSLSEDTGAGCQGGDDGGD